MLDYVCVINFLLIIIIKLCVFVLCVHVQIPSAQIRTRRALQLGEVTGQSQYQLQLMPHPCFTIVTACNRVEQFPILPLANATSCLILSLCTLHRSYWTDSSPVLSSRLSPLSAGRSPNPLKQTGLFNGLMTGMLISYTKWQMSTKLYAIVVVAPTSSSLIARSHKLHLQFGTIYHTCHLRPFQPNIIPVAAKNWSL